MKQTVVGIDIAKRVFQLHWIDVDSGEIFNIALKREKFLAHFVNLPPCMIGMEACGGAQHWARKLIKLGHQVKLLKGKFVKSFVMGNKGDAADAKGICMAVQQPGVKPIAIKTKQQQAVLALHRMRQSLVKIRTVQINALRGLLTEYGELMPVGHMGLRNGIAAAIAKLESRLPTIVIEALRELWLRIVELNLQVSNIELKLKVWLNGDSSAKAIADIPGVGLLTATAAVATMGDPKSFKSGREFAAWLGLVPGQTGSGGKTKLLGISKRGDTYLRTLLTHGARNVLNRSKNLGQWTEQLSKRKHHNVVVMAIANKMARTIWAMLAHGRAYQSSWSSRSPT
jgi:transposase